jgi:hypothetical protein
MNEDGEENKHRSKYFTSLVRLLSSGLLVSLVLICVTSKLNLKVYRNAIFDKQSNGSIDGFYTKPHEMVHEVTYVFQSFNQEFSSLRVI